MTSPKKPRLPLDRRDDSIGRARRLVDLFLRLATSLLRIAREAGWLRQSNSKNPRDRSKRNEGPGPGEP